jgi:hypothetical protein
MNQVLIQVKLQMIEVSRVGFGMLVKMLFDIGARIWN